MASSKNRSNSKAPANASAPSTTTEADVHSEHDTADAGGVAVSPPGTSEPGGTNTRSEESGDAAGATSVDLVKPLEGAEPTQANPAEAATPTVSSILPEAEASASGTNSTDTSEGTEAAEVGAGDMASPAAAPAWARLSKDEFKVAYPLTFAFLSNIETDVASSASSLRVTSKGAGFRRGGMAHSATGTDFNPGELTPDLIEAFLAEPMLTVEIV
ncbi:hypothetical protein AB4Z13_14400 [Rhizobium sp. YAF28]|uniref:hypothetical protein n=1 Tax=Rhizobium sp. YAF28 TaxID=3233081 RepID=UPI003F95F3EC